MNELCVQVAQPWLAGRGVPSLQRMRLVEAFAVTLETSSALSHVPVTAFLCDQFVPTIGPSIRNRYWQLYSVVAGPQICHETVGSREFWYSI